jgi:sugar phosphate isomerase/epimerase
MAVFPDTVRGTLPIGVFADNLELPLREALRTIADLGVSSFQCFTRGGMAPEALSQQARAEFRRFFEGLGLTLSATCADLGHGFVDAAENAPKVAHMRAQIDLAVELGTGIITTHIGTIPARPDYVWVAMRDALNAVGDYAESRGILIATETGPENGPTLRTLLETLDTEAIRVNFDPANLVMNGYDLDEALDALYPFIVHTHAKDGFRDPGQWREAPLGTGDVPWPHYVARMQTLGYAGVYTIEREQAEDRIADVTAGIAFLRQF